MRKVDVFVKGPGSGRETAIRSLQATGLEVGSIQDVTPVAAQRLPSAQAPPRLTQRQTRRRHHGPVHRRGLQALPPREDEAVPQGRQVRVRRSARSRSVPTRRASTAAVAPRTASTCCRCARSRSARASTACSRSSSAATTRRPTASQGKTGENLLRILESPPRQRRLPRRLRASRVTWPASWSGTATSSSTATRSTSRRYRVSENDIVEVRASSLELTPFVIARAEAGERTVPAWLEVIPNRMRILVHSPPGPPGHRHPGPGAADRRALQQVGTIPAAAGLPPRRAHVRDVI